MIVVKGRLSLNEIGRLRESFAKVSFEQPYFVGEETYLRVKAQKPSDDLEQIEQQVARWIGDAAQVV